MSEIKAITMPKWGLAMEEGIVAKWAVNEGDVISPGEEILDIETSKIANVYESPVSGILRRKIASDGDILPVGALMAVVAERDTSEASIDAFIAEFNAKLSAAARKDGDGPTRQIVEIGGKRISYLRVGPEKGEPVVFIHGFGSDHTAWLFNQPMLAESHPTYALDLPGHGASDKYADDFSAEALAGTIGAFLDKLGLKDIHLVGHSLGGAIAALVAEANPALVKSVTLIAPAGLGMDIMGSFFDGFIEEERSRKLRPYIEMLVADPRVVTGEMVEDVLKFKRVDGALAALKAVRAANFPGSTQKISIREALDGLSIPVQVMVGSSDKIIPASQSNGLSGADWVEIAGAGHIPHLEKANEVNDRIHAFINKGR